MRILVISDSHGRRSVIENAIEAHPDAGHVFFLGDKVEDIEDMTYYKDRTFHIVAGNCDYNSFLKTADSIVLDGVKIFFTHGHAYGVKGGIGALRREADRIGAEIVLYGHTHIANIEYADGVYFVNPGSVSCPREGKPSYAVIDIEKNGIMPIKIEI